MKKTTHILLLTILLLSCGGCGFFKDSGPKRRFPGDIKNQAYGALNEAERRINTVGKHRIKPKSVTLRLQEGQRRISGVWTFQDPRLPGLWIGGITSGNGSSVIVAHAPGNRLAFDMEIMIHEFVHHWLSSNGWNVGHDPVYDHLIKWWSSSRRGQGRSVKDSEINVLYIEEIDIITTKAFNTIPKIAVWFEDAQGDVCVAHGFYINPEEDNGEDL